VALNTITLTLLIIILRLYVAKLTLTLNKIQLIPESFTKHVINQFLELLLPVYKDHIVVPKEVRFLSL